MTFTYRTSADSVHDLLGRHMLADGLPIVLDLEASRGGHVRDARTGDDYLDLFSFFASQPVGYNHPKVMDPEFLTHLGRIAASKPVNSDLYSCAMADFVETFAGIVPDAFKSHLFFVEGGALAVENAMKAAFDWKYRKNVAATGSSTEDLEIVHFHNAFHGRSGYTLSVTNTHDPRKYEYFPKFDWLRLPEPASHRDDVEATEAEALSLLDAAIADRADRLAAVMIETIQGEGGDNHFRPAFLTALRERCDAHDMLLIFDEVQCGMGITGTWWAFEQLGVEPDIFSFGKKTQVCGIAANRRLDEVDSVFEVSSRINSTWGGNLVDMVRAERYIQIIQEEGLLENAGTLGAYAVNALQALADDTGKISDVRGAGLMIAFDLPDADERNRVQARLMENKAIILSCGDRSLRFRPVLDFSEADVDATVDVIRRSL